MICTFGLIEGFYNSGITGSAGLVEGFSTEVYKTVFLFDPLVSITLLFSIPADSIPLSLVFIVPDSSGEVCASSSFSLRESSLLIRS